MWMEISGGQTVEVSQYIYIYIYIYVYMCVCISLQFVWNGLIDKQMDRF